MKIIFTYLLLVNALGLLLMIVDKQQAKKRSRRISEANLMTVAALGGSIGCLIGMLMVRHKTRHLKFTIGLPVLVFIHTCLVLLCLILP